MIGGHQIVSVGPSCYQIQVLSRQPITSGLLYRVRNTGHTSVGENRQGPIGTGGKVSDLCFRLGLHGVNLEWVDLTGHGALNESKFFSVEAPLGIYNFSVDTCFHQFKK